MELDESIKAINRKLWLIGLIDGVAMAAIGIGLFATFDESPGSLHPLLGDREFVRLMFWFAIPVAVICFPAKLKLNAEKRRLMQP